jgi:hypothetical protein
VSIDPQDLVDLGIVDQTELASIGSAADAYRTGVTVVDTTSSNRRVEVSGFDLAGLAVGSREDRVEVGDKLVLTGTTAADGTYTVESIFDTAHVVVVEAIPDSTGGTAEFRHPPGAGKVGFDSTGLTNTSASDVQNAISDLDGAISGGGVDDKTVKVSSDDTTPAFLEDKLQAGPAIDLVTANPAGNEKVEISVGFRRQFLLMGG